MATTILWGLGFMDANLLNYLLRTNLETRLQSGIFGWGEVRPMILQRTRHCWDSGMGSLIQDTNDVVLRTGPRNGATHKKKSHS